MSDYLYFQCAELIRAQAISVIKNAIVCAANTTNADEMIAWGNLIKSIERAEQEVSATANLVATLSVDDEQLNAKIAAAMSEVVKAAIAGKKECVVSGYGVKLVEALHNAGFSCSPQADNFVLVRWP